MTLKFSDQTVFDNCLQKGDNLHICRHLSPDRGDCLPFGDMSLAVKGIIHDSKIHDCGYVACQLQQKLTWLFRQATVKSGTP